MKAQVQLILGVLLLYIPAEGGSDHAGRWGKLKARTRLALW